jgi:frataxin
MSSGLKGITPDDKAPKPVETPPVTRTPADISEGEYHTVADEYLEKLLTRLEQLQDAREDVDVEYSVNHPTPTPTLSVPVQTLTAHPPARPAS